MPPFGKTQQVCDNKGCKTKLYHMYVVCSVNLCDSTANRLPLDWTGEGSCRLVVTTNDGQNVTVQFPIRTSRDTFYWGPIKHGRHSESGQIQTPCCFYEVDTSTCHVGSKGHMTIM